MKWRTDTIAIVIVTFCTAIDGISLDCSYGMVSWAILGSIYTCTGRVLLDGNVSENVTAVFGGHQDGKGHQDVRGIYLPSQNLHFVPTNIESFFPNIVAISLQNNSITTVSNRHLIRIPNLQALSLYENKITSIDGDLFSGMDSMRYINFHYNNVRHVGHDLNLPINGDIRFSTNPCIDQNGATPDAIAILKLNLLRNCPPTISQIEDSLEKRQNFLTRIDGQVQSLITNTDEMSDELAAQRNETNNELATLRNEMNQMNNQLATLRNQMNEELATLRNQMTNELATLRNEQANLWAVMYDFNRRIEHLETINEDKPFDQF